ncbi:unnamed protein product [Urochloa humidicola]
MPPNHLALLPRRGSSGDVSRQRSSREERELHARRRALAAAAAVLGGARGEAEEMRRRRKDLRGRRSRPELHGPSSSSMAKIEEEKLSTSREIRSLRRLLRLPPASRSAATGAPPSPAARRPCRDAAAMDTKEAELLLRSRRSLNRRHREALWGPCSSSGRSIWRGEGGLDEGGARFGGDRLRFAQPPE